LKPRKPETAPDILSCCNGLISILAPKNQFRYFPPFRYLMPVLALKARPPEANRFRGTPMREWALDECASNGASFVFFPPPYSDLISVVSMYARDSCMDAASD